MFERLCLNVWRFIVLLDVFSMMARSLLVSLGENTKILTFDGNITEENFKTVS